MNLPEHFRDEVFQGRKKLTEAIRVDDVIANWYFRDGGTKVASDVLFGD